MSPFAFYSVPLRQDLFRETAGKILLNLGELLLKGEVFGGGSLGGKSQIVATFEAEFAIRRYAVAAARTGELELSPAFFAEHGTTGQLDIALWAFHCFPHRTVERG